MNILNCLTSGLTVVGGEDTRRLHFGIFIKKISPGSIAHEDGRLQVGKLNIYYSYYLIFSVLYNLLINFLIEDLTDVPRCYRSLDPTL